MKADVNLFFRLKINKMAALAYCRLSKTIIISQRTRENFRSYRQIKENEVSFSRIFPVIGYAFRHNIVKVALNLPGDSLKIINPCVCLLIDNENKPMSALEFLQLF